MRARLQVLEVPVPRLQERREDLPLLAHHALAGAGAGAPADAELSAPALQRLRAWSWPGHLGELRAVLAAARLRAAHGRIQAHHLALPTEPGTRTAADIVSTITEEETPCLRTDVEAYKRARVSGALRESDGNQLLAAERLGLHASNLSRLMKTLGLRD